MSLSPPKYDVAPAYRLVVKELQRPVTAPISASGIREYFTNREIEFHINVKNSRLKDGLLLTYLTNLDMPVNLEIDINDYEQWGTLLKAYFEQRSIVKTHQLTLLAEEMILHFAGVSRWLRPSFMLLDSDHKERFCKENEDVLALWRVFLDSMTVYMGRNLMKLKFDDNEELLVIDDADAIGHNVVNLIKSPDFLRTYFAHTELRAKAYFKQQFEERMFGGRDLSYYFFCPDNTTQSLLNNQLVLAAQSEEGKLIRDYIHQQLQ